ncbi:hypothetical protein CIPAW_15G019900 [Carya illinoinensis]|uniref:Uncharacterized protein n=1 Tax=Carya illinoinensis TaxID=32201 RepID=A0A8T1NAF0_CARIL|nr:hypothetical protein CIPAW_15G019900 [Carya illinoinensis]KAG6674001.1 hypothetical protein I3842_15G020300 [Carya illinoinensis]
MTCKMVLSKIHSKVVMVLLALIVVIMLLTFSDSAALANAKFFGRKAPDIGETQPYKWEPRFPPGRG